MRALARAVHLSGCGAGKHTAVARSLLDVAARTPDVVELATRTAEEEVDEADEALLLMRSGGRAPLGVCNAVGRMSATTMQNAGLIGPGRQMCGARWDGRSRG